MEKIILKYGNEISGCSLCIKTYLIYFLLFRRRLANSQQQPAPTSQPEAYYKGHYSTYAGTRTRELKDSGYSTSKTSTSGWYQTGICENDYAYNMELRPLPSLPDVHEASRYGGGENNMFVNQEFHTLPHGHGGQHMYYAPKNLRNGHDLSGPHYFELDPELDDISDGSQFLDSNTGIPDNRYMGHPVLMPRHKSPEQENAENIGKEVAHLNNSCQDMQTVSPTNTNPPQYKETGNCSWP